MIMEYLNRLILKINIYIHKLFNRSLYKSNVQLYGIPKLVYRNRIKFGKDVRINEDVFLHAAGGIEIKSNTTLSYGTTVLSTGYDTINWSNSSKRKHIEKKIIIGENVWIGANVTILKDVYIADDCIIGAGSIVNKSLKESGYLYAGTPAKKIKKIN